AAGAVDRLEPRGVVLGAVHEQAHLVAADERRARRAGEHPIGELAEVGELGAICPRSPSDRRERSCVAPSLGSWLRTGHPGGSSRDRGEMRGPAGGSADPGFHTLAFTPWPSHPGLHTVALWPRARRRGCAPRRCLPRARRGSRGRTDFAPWEILSRSAPPSSTISTAPSRRATSKNTASCPTI